jgi:predicted enzyme related to lactoylglutathione lyase
MSSASSVRLVNRERATEFYRSAFGWDINPMPEMDYTILGTTPTNEQGMPAEPGAINGSMFKREASRGRRLSLRLWRVGDKALRIHCQQEVSVA